MRQINILILLLMPIFLEAQNCRNSSGIGTLNVNDIQAVFKPTGSFFDEQVNTGFDMIDSHTNSLRSTIFAGALWLGGYSNDSSRQLKIAAQRYRVKGEDYFPGPIVNGLANMCSEFDRTWSVSGTVVRALIQDYTDNGIIDNTIDPTLLAWPGRGNPHFLSQNGFNLPNQDLAPFKDVNNDGIYNPMDGDYPVADEQYLDIIADELLWTVYNDVAATHTESHGQILGVEVQLTAYAFNCSTDPILNQTIFVKQRIINKATVGLLDFRVGLWTNFMLGCEGDDAFGTIPNQHTVYGYNLDNEDDSICNFGLGGYGLNPPVQAVTFLNQPLTSSLLDPRGTNNTSDPIPPVVFYNMMDNKWPDGKPLRIGEDGYYPHFSTIPTTDFIFPDNPNDTTGWSFYQDSIACSGLEPRVVMATKKDTFNVGERLDLVAAYSYHRDLDSSHLQNVNLMYQQVPIVQQFYDNGYQNNTCSNLVPIQKIAIAQPTHIKAYPNPTNGIFTIESDEMIHSIQIFDILGQPIAQYTNLESNLPTINLGQFHDGIYLLKIETAAGKTTQKVQLQKL